ncbi:MAG: hypothetical protein GY832_44710 [Chloroflexi bacterium]|nr:hypothetical protein [Chloroflexota bacterium]
MNTKTRLILIVALLGISAVVLAVVFMQRGGTPTPATTPSLATEPSGTTDIAATLGATAPPDETAPPTTPEATATIIPLDGTTIGPDAQATTPAPTPTPTEGEEAAAAVGQGYTAYRPTQTECEQIVDDGQVVACVWFDSARLIVRSEWEQLFPDTDFYVLGLGGYRPDSTEPYDSRRRLVAWQDDKHYTAKTFDRLLKANGVTITDENRELVAKAFALMTIPDYLEEEVVLTEWEEVNMQPALHNYNYCLGLWTKLQGLEIKWCFVFGNERLRIASGPAVQQDDVGDYIDVSVIELPPPSFVDYQFRGE